MKLKCLSFTFKQSPRDKFFIEKVLRKSLYWFYERDNFLKVFSISWESLTSIKTTLSKAIPKIFWSDHKSSSQHLMIGGKHELGGGGGYLPKNAIFRKKSFFGQNCPWKNAGWFHSWISKGVPLISPKVLGWREPFLDKISERVSQSLPVHTM